MVRLIVDAARGSYPVIIGSEVHRELRGVVRRLEPTSAVIVTDSNVRPWARRVAKAVKPAGVKPSIHVVPAGERSKSMAALHDVLAFLERQKVDRGGLVIAVGGGTVGDQEPVRRRRAVTDSHRPPFRVIPGRMGCAEQRGDVAPTHAAWRSRSAATAPPRATRGLSVLDKIG